MFHDKVICPTCSTEIVLTEALEREIGEKAAALANSKVATLQDALAAKEKALQAKQDEMKASAEKIDAEVKLKVQATLMEQQKQIKAKLDAQYALEREEMQNALAEKSQKITEFQRMELDLRRKANALLEEKESLQLEVQRKLDEERSKIEEDVRLRTSEDHRMKLLEKEKQIETMRVTIDQLKAKAEQGSQQTQGEVLELALEDLLQSAFPGDEIVPVPKGVNGADVIQRVLCAAGVAGSIIWETKRAKTWTDSWIQKLREDQRAAGADIAILVTKVMPKDAKEAIVLIDDVWVVSFTHATGLVRALRAGLLQLHRSKAVTVGKREKSEIVYSYLLSTPFKQRIEGIVENFVAMKTDLDREKRSTQRAWATREKHIDGVIEHTVGMYGDLQGLVGTMPMIPQLQLPEPGGTGEF